MADFVWIPAARKHVGFEVDRLMFPPESFGEGFSLMQWDAVQGYEHWLLTSSEGRERLRLLVEKEAQDR